MGTIMAFKHLLNQPEWPLGVKEMFLTEGKDFQHRRRFLSDTEITGMITGKQYKEVCVPAPELP